MDLASIYFGLFLGIFVFTLAKSLEQTRSIWRRTRSLANIYLYMIWFEAWVNFIFAIITFLFLNKIIPPSLEFFLATVGLWSIQTQLLPQIIANRVSLIMINKRGAKRLKWSLVCIIGIINIAVCYIWVTAQMPSATPFQIAVNHVFERAEKCFFLIVDLGLNIYFLYLVRFRLIADGLSKYWRLFNFNVAMVVISTSMDAMLLGFLSLPNPYLYVQFAPVAYIVKLYIELMMAVLISKVVKSGASGRGDGRYGSSGHKSNPVNNTTSRVVVSGGDTFQRSGTSFLSKLRKEQGTRVSSTGSEIHLATFADPYSITKTVETTVMVDNGDDTYSDKS
ncbi:hypothetical protein BGZ63DRAFT_436110 [Mariannaea sp. PMI_226]|nr:hypothetical protein BGZ63DRAFT_436110 [Mariannaea sp. PMI_226]